MKKTRTISFIITVLLAIAIIVGIAIQVLSPRSLLDSTYEIIAFLISGVSVGIALLSQISAYHERREYSKIIRELNEIIADTEAEIAMDQKASKKLDELLALDHRIYGRIAKETKRKAKK